MANFVETDRMNLQASYTPKNRKVVCLLGVEITPSIDKRFWSKVKHDCPNGCWEWQGSISPKGYGQFRLLSPRVMEKHGKRKGIVIQAHRLTYAAFVGDMPEGLVIDHLCRNRRCVNPAHLEAVTSRENTLRGETIPAMYAKATHCIHGHELTPENIVPSSSYRKCLTCTRVSGKSRMRKKRAELKARKVA